MTLSKNLAAKTLGIFPALSHWPFRWFWFGQIISLIGTWTQNIGQAWLVLELTDSPFLLGLVSAAQFAPVLFLSLPAGAWIDRLPKRRLILMTQASLMLLAFTLALIVGTGIIEYWMILTLALFLGAANTLDMPARQSFMIELVGREHLANAIALNSAIFNGARLMGPALAALIMAIWGPMWCFLINGVSFIGVILILMKLEDPPRETLKDTKTTAIRHEILEGLHYIRGNTEILSIIVLLGFLSIVALNFNVLIPILAKYDLREQVLGFGMLMSALGIGALLGSMTVAVFSRKGPPRRLLVIGSGGIGVFSLLIGFITSYEQGIVLLVLLGCSMILFTASANSTIQLSVANRFRGRVMSVHSLVFGGMVPIGSLYSGAMADCLGAKITFLINGILSLLFIVGLFYWRKSRIGGENRADRRSV